MAVGFTGTQDGITHKQVLQLLNTYLIHESEIHHGDCIGADEQFHYLARSIQMPSIQIHPPINESKRAFCDGPGVDILPAKEYLDRNKDIVNATEYLIACPGGYEEIMRSGTWSTVRYAAKKEKDVYIIFPDGSVQVRYNAKLRST